MNVHEQRRIEAEIRKELCTATTIKEDARRLRASVSRKRKEDCNADHQPTRTEGSQAAA
jgi:hypothetical protein